MLAGKIKLHTIIARQMTLQTEDQLFQIALQHHQTGGLLKAENFYLQILLKNPNHPDALYLLGTLYHQTGNNEKALE
jgi:tetratricopeptide (TPR) repeat protein